MRYNFSGLVSSTRPTLPLSFHADTHQSVGSLRSNGYVPRKYSKKSGATSRSSKKIKTILVNLALNNAEYKKNFIQRCRCRVESASNIQIQRTRTHVFPLIQSIFYLQCGKFLNLCYTG